MQIRDMIEIFVTRAELQSPHGEDTQELRKQQADALKAVETDKQSHKLFNGIFSKKSRAKPVCDPTDHVYRCPDCLYEIEDNRCTNCGQRFRASDLHSDMSSNSDSETGSDDESDSNYGLDEDEEMEEDFLDRLEQEDDDYRRHLQRSWAANAGDIRRALENGNVDAVQQRAFEILTSAPRHQSRFTAVGAESSRNRSHHHHHHDHHDEDDWDDEEDDSEEEEEEDESDSDLSGFIEHDTPEHRRSRPHRLNSRPISISPDPESHTSAIRRNRRAIVSDDDDDDDDDASSVSDIHPRSGRGDRSFHLSNGGRRPIVISSDNEDEEAEGLIRDNDGYAELDHDTTENDDDDDYGGVSGSDVGYRNTRSLSVQSASTINGSNTPQQRTTGPGEGTSRRSRSVKFSVPDDADEEDYESDGGRDNEGDLDMDRYSAGGSNLGSASPDARRSRVQGSNNSRFQEDTQIDVDDDDESEDSLPVQRRRRYGAVSSSNIRGNSGNNTSVRQSQRSNHTNTNLRVNSRRVIPSVRRALTDHSRRREQQQFDELGRSNGEPGNGAARTSTEPSSARRDLEQLNEPIVIDSSPMVTTRRTQNQVPPLMGAGTRLSSTTSPLPSPPSATISSFTSNPSPFEMERAASNTPSRSSSHQPTSPEQQPTTAETPSSREARTQQSRDGNCTGSMRRRSNIALREQQPHNRQRDAISRRTDASRASNTTSSTRTDEERQRLGRQLMLERQQVLANRASTSGITRAQTSDLTTMNHRPTRSSSMNPASSVTNNASTAGGRLQDIQSQHELSLQRRLDNRRTNSDSIVPQVNRSTSRDSATPVPATATAQETTPQPETIPGVRRTDTAGSLGTRRRAAIGIGSGPGRGGPLLVIGDEDEL